jgi:hypothetical protein
MKKLFAILTLAAFTLPFAMPAAAAGKNNKSTKQKKGKKHKNDPAK